MSNCSGRQPQECSSVFRLKCFEEGKAVFSDGLHILLVPTALASLDDGITQVFQWLPDLITCSILFVKTAKKNLSRIPQIDVLLMVPLFKISRPYIFWKSQSPIVKLWSLLKLEIVQFWRLLLNLEGTNGTSFNATPESKLKELEWSKQILDSWVVSLV